MGRNPKRRSGGRSRPTTPAKRPRTQWSDSTFGRMLESAGMTLNGEQQNDLAVEPTVFQRQLSNAFRRHSDLIQVTEEFCEGLRDYIDSPVRFRMCLLPTKIAEGADVMARSMGLDSLLRLLLGVESIQPSVVGVLLERMPEYMDDTGNVDVLGVREYHQMPQLILSQLKWLDHVVKGKELCGNLLEVVSVAPLGIQREIITALPEVLDDAQHNHAALELKSLLQTNSDITAAVIDALSNLNIETDTAAEVLDVALGRVSSANIADLPTVIKFVMQQVTSKNAQEIISELRERLDFESTFLPPPAASSTPRSTQLHLARLSTETSDQFVVFDTIRSSICFQKAVADGWMKAIESVSEAGSHKAIDVFVLFILHSISSRKKAVESLFSAKIRSRLFSADLMSTVFGSHTGALRGFFPSILSLCETLLCSSSPSITAFTTSLYQHVFGSFDVYCQQEVIGALITHIGSGMASEIDHALDALAALVETQGKAMQRFAILIKGVLDYLEHLSVAQIRRLYQVLSVLAFSAPEEASSVQDELHTLIRKQLSHTESKYRRMGVMGAVMIVQQLAQRRDVTDLSLQAAMASQARESTLPPSRRKQAISMLDDVMRSCSRSPESSILFCDEMSSVVQKGTLDTAILRHLGDEITTKFQDTYLVESGDPLPSDLGLPLQLAYGLDSSEEGSIALNLLPLGMQQADRGQERGAILRALPAHFRLLRCCEHALNDNLEGIDALLGCPVVVCSKEKLKTEVFEDLSMTKRQDICLSLFYLLNWFRELVCGFAGETDVDMKGKVVIRLQDITELQSQMESCMTGTPGFLPPSVRTEEVTPPTTRGRKGSKSSKGDTTVLSVTCTTQNVDKDSTSLDKTATTATVSIDHIRSYFRELDLGGFAPLHYGPLSRTVIDSENHTKEQEELKLHPHQLLFLLRDLSDKLGLCLSAFGGKSMAARSGRGSMASYTTDQLVATVTKLMPALCEHLENTGVFFQAQMVESDGMVDAESSHQDFPVLCTCLHLLLRTMGTFFAWSPLSDPHYEEQLWASVRAIATRATQSASQLQASLPHLARTAVKYLEQLSEFLPTLTSAHSLARLLVAICKTCKAEHLKKPIATACGGLLKRPWRAGESSSQRNEALDYLLRYHLEWADDPLGLAEGITGESIAELLGEEAQEVSSTYPTLSNATFPSYYRCIMAALVSQVKAIPPPSKKSVPTVEVLTDHFHILELSAKVLLIMVNLVKSFEGRSVFVAVLKYGKLYVEAFLKSGMPVLNSLFRQRKDDVIALLKTLQQSTRNLQHFCSHSKVTKDIMLTNHVPQLKKCLEMLLFSVKEMLTNHNCLEAFWVGNLKNRDVQGQEILSQTSQTSTEQYGDNESEAEEETNSTSTDRREPILSSDEED